MRGKREGPCGVQGPRGPGPGPGGPPGAPPHRTRPAAVTFATPVARQNRPGPSGGVPHMPGVPPAPQSLLPHPQVQDWTQAAGLPPAAALCTGPGIRATPDRNWLRPPPASGPGQGPTSDTRKKTAGSRAPGRGHSGPAESGTNVSSPGPRHTLPGREPQVWKPSLTKLHPPSRASAAGTKAGCGLPKAQVFSDSKEACLSKVHSAKVASRAAEPRRLARALPPNPSHPARPQISGSPRDTLKGWLAGSQVCAPALNPGSPLWSLLSPG